METVHISQFYPCSKIEIPCELFYVCELSKYLYYNYNKVLSVDGVIVSSKLERTSYFNYFKYFVSLGYIVNSNITDLTYDVDVNNIINVLYTEDRVRYNANDRENRKESLAYKFKNPERRQVIFADKSDKEWLWQLNSDNTSINSVSMSDNLARQVWLSLVAYVAVERLVNGRPNKFNIVISSQLITDRSTISYLLFLLDKSSCFEDWLNISYDKSVSANTKAQLGYVAWYYDGYDKGYHYLAVTSTEKYEEIKRLDIQVGDLVWYYKRNYDQNYNYLKSIESCSLAKVIKLDKQGVTLECIYTNNTYYDGKRKFEDNTTIVKKMYADKKPYEKLNTSIVRTDWYNCGVNHVFYDELEFITPIGEAEDIVISSIPVKGTDYKYRFIRIPQNDLIYWMLEDYHYEYNKDRFLNTYFNGRTPLKEYYDNHLDLPEIFYLSEPQG